MRAVALWVFVLMIFIGKACEHVVKAITMEQFEQSLEMMRNGCAPKFKVSVDILDKMRNGDFSNTDKDYMEHLMFKLGVQALTLNSRMTRIEHTQHKRSDNVGILRASILPIVMSNSKASSLQCYTKCVAQLAGTVTKKGEFSFTKAVAQIPIILPPELHDPARAALNGCREVQKNYKESCEKVFYVTKCVADFDPAHFKYP